MINTLIQKELKTIILSPKFIATFAICSVLMLLSVYIGIQEYQTASRVYETSSQLADMELRSQTSWGHLSDRSLRKPQPLQIFASGLDYDIGRWSSISPVSAVKLRHSAYSDDPIFAVFRFVDFTFIVVFVLTLFAILFTYNSVNGEREDGTLRLVFSNSVSRAAYLVSKCVGAWLGLVVPICVPILLCLLMVILSGVPLSPIDWSKLLMLIGLSLLLFTFFIVLGVLVSTLTRRSSVSFLVSLVIWITAVIIIPRAGVAAAGSMIHVPRVAEIEGQRDAFTKDKWATYVKESGTRWEEFNREQNKTDDTLSDAAMWKQMMAEDEERKAIEIEIEDYYSRLSEDLEQRKNQQQRVAFMLARFSPVSAYQLAAMSLAGTGPKLKSHYVEAMTDFRKQFNEYTEEMAQKTGNTGGITVQMSSDGGFKLSMARNKDGLDIGGLPRFQTPSLSVAESIEPVVIDFGLLVLATILSFAGAFVSFLRYDVR